MTFAQRATNVTLDTDKSAVKSANRGNEAFSSTRNISKSRIKTQKAKKTGQMSLSTVSKQSVTTREDPINGGERTIRTITKSAKGSASDIVNTIDISKRNAPPEAKNLSTDRNKSLANNNKRTIMDTAFEANSIKTIENYHHKESKKAARDVKDIDPREQPGAMEVDSQTDSILSLFPLPYKASPKSLNFPPSPVLSTGRPRRKTSRDREPTKDERSSGSDKNSTHRI